MIDATELARKLLAAVYRTGQSFGFGHLQKVLTGAADERVLQRGHDRLSVFGIVGGEEARLLAPLTRALQARGSLVATEHGGLALGGDARAILKGEAAVEIVQPGADTKEERRGASSAQPGRRSAVRGAARAAARACGRGASAALRDLPRCDLARDGAQRGRPRYASSARFRASARASSSLCRRRSWRESGGIEGACRLCLTCDDHVVANMIS